MSLVDDFDSTEEDFDEDFEFEFQLLNSEDGKIITLVCSANRELSPDEYVQALIAFAERMEALSSLSDASNTMN